jgi:hypothetical protein
MRDSFPPLALLIIATLTLLGCEHKDETSDQRSTGREAAELAVRDLTLIFQDAFLEVISRGPGTSGTRTNEISTPRMKFTWSQDTSFATGSGRFELLLDRYVIRSGSPYREEYSGYVASGHLVLDTDLSRIYFSEIEVELEHRQSDLFPVTSVTAGIHRGPGGIAAPAQFVNVDKSVFPAALLYSRQSTQ